MIRKEHRGGVRHLVIDFRYTDTHGKKKRYRRDAEVQTSAAAVAEERRLLVELGSTGSIRKVEPPSAPTASAVTWVDAVDHHRRVVLPTKKPSTRASYTELLTSAMMRSWKAVIITSDMRPIVVPWDAKIVQSGVGPNRRRNFHVAVRAVLRAAVDAAMIPDMPRVPKLPRVGRKIRSRPTRADVDRLLAAAPPAERLALALAAHAGLRASEVRGLRWTDVDLGGGMITVRQSISEGQVGAPKSGHDRQVPIQTALLPLLEEAPRKGVYVAPRADGKPWGSWRLGDAMQRACAAAHVSYTFHDLRGAFATSLFRASASAPAVQRLMGHANLATTQLYADVVESDLRAAIRKLG